MGFRLLALTVLQTLDASAQPKEAGTTPGRAGDGARDGGEACVGRLAPDVPAPNDGDRVPLALVFADQHGAGLETPAVHLRLVAPCKAVQQLCYVPIKTTEGLLLDVPADKPRHE